MWARRREQAELAQILRILSTRATQPIIHDDSDAQDFPIHQFHSVFPNLRSLYWNYDIAPAILDLPVFFGPRLRSLEFDLRDRANAALLEASLALIPQLAPQLEELKLPVWIESFPSPAFDDTLGQMRNLRKLTIRVERPEMVPIIAALPRLKRLNMSYHVDVEQPRNAGPSSRDIPSAPLNDVDEEVCFPSLVDLDLNGEEMGDDLDACSTLLHAFPPRHLRTLRVLRNTIRGSQAIHAFFFALAHAVHPASLTSLVIETVGYSSHPPNTPPDACVTIADLRPLLVFSNLEDIDLNIYAPLPWQLDDAAFAQLARAWPSLTSLTMHCWNAETRDPPLPTLKTVKSLAAHCPRIASVSLDLNTSAPLPSLTDEDEDPYYVRSPCGSSSQSGDAVSGECLVSLNVNFSPLLAESGPLGPPAIAAFLSSVFPQLKSVWTNKYSRHAKKWRQVSKLLPILAVTKRWGEHRKSSA